MRTVLPLQVLRKEGGVLAAGMEEVGEKLFSSTQNFWQSTREGHGFHSECPGSLKLPRKKPLLVICSPTL